MSAVVDRRSAGAAGVEVLDRLPADSPEWSALALAADNVFLTPEWLLNWWQHFGCGRPVYSFVGRDGDGRLRFLVATYLERRRPLRVLRLIGHGPSDELGPICRGGDREYAANALRAGLRENRLADVFVADELSGAAAWSAPVLGSTPSPTVRIGEGWDEFISSRPPRFRTAIRRLERKFPNTGFSVRRVDDESGLERAFDWLLDAHRRRLGESSNLLKPRMAAFHRDFGRIALARGWLRFLLLERDGEIAAAWYGFRFGSADYFYQQARSLECPSGAGKYLSAVAVRATCDDGLREHRFLRGGEPYKFEWANHDDGVATVALALTRKGEAIVGAVGAHTLGRAARRVFVG
jgi:CelD/BcsL family acetyltransferase involved in cellulose biosynthesis